MTLLAAQALTVTVRIGGAAVPVIRHLDFALAPGKTLGLVDESGAGKSMVRRAIAQLLPPGFAVTGGRLAFAGEDLVTMPTPGEAAARYPARLSGGQRQRVNIARALCIAPKVLIADEIVSGLDVSVQAQLINLLLRLREEHGFSMLFISHDLAVVRAISQRVGVLYRGELVETGMVEEVYAPPFHPYTHVLLSAVPEIGAEQELSSALRIDATPGGTGRRTACPFADRCPWKLGPVCEDEPPPWRFTSKTHALRCHIPLEELHARESGGGGISAMHSPEKEPA